MLKEPLPQKNSENWAHRLSMGAREAAKLSPEFMPLAAGSILLSVAWLEGAINELLVEVDSGSFSKDLEPLVLLQRIARVAALTDRNTALLQRLRTISVCLTTKDIDLSHRDSQSLKLALDVRNAIAHPRPMGVETVDAFTEDGIPTKHLKSLPLLTQRLAEAKVIKKVNRKLIHSDALALQSAPVAQFVYGACRKTLENVRSWLPSHHQKITCLNRALQE